MGDEANPRAFSPFRITPLVLKTYLAHVIGGHPMRHLARVEGVHASTILRRIRRVKAAQNCPVFREFLTAQEEGCRNGKAIHLYPRFLILPKESDPAKNTPDSAVEARFQKLVTPLLVDGNP